MHSPRSTTRAPGRNAGFTLAEVVIVVLILGIIAAITVGSVRHSYEDTIAATLSRNLDVIYDAIDLNSPGQLPNQIEGEWFVGGNVPRHPQTLGGANGVQIDSTPSKTHPASKVIASGLQPYWYNPTNGIFRSRVVPVGSETETLDFYNLINESDESSLGNYGGGGGGGK